MLNELEIEPPTEWSEQPDEATGATRERLLTHDDGAMSVINGDVGNGFMSLIKLTKFGNKNIEGPTGKRTLRPVILADSKGVRLQQQFVHKDQSNIIWWCKRGRKVHEAIDWLKTNLETEIQLIGDIWLYIWVGTCNLTSFDRSTRYICLSSSKSQETVDQVTTTYKDIIQLFAKYPNCKLTFLETPFYSIVNWNSKQKHKNPSTFLEQDHLLEPERKSETVS
ncbi:unnamed protein product [Mytilus edulis]|uniref:Uncharacterized protein n=1 Tax=Mytilus edulis TaxID=6550 RepID=A0A8S3S6R8_MYTED|nr:unnamed protein product [Mytilus edulis]